MIDSHSHTFYSKHAIGTVDELVRASIKAGVRVLTITDHAPFPVDSDNRLLESELDSYFADIQRAQAAYRGEIKILRGLEFDYMPGSDIYNRALLARHELDFVIGSIHYVEVPGEPMVKVWELPRLAAQNFLDRYFADLEALLRSGLFDAVGHADTLLRGVDEEVVLRHFEPLLPLFARNGVAYELNASGIRKSSLDNASGREVHGRWSYPSRALLPHLIEHQAAFTVGSDTHDPRDAGAGIRELLQSLQPLGLQSICYYESRRRVDVPLGTLTATVAISDGLIQP
ncbi:histidinol-phosphatase [Pseudomonas reactans]|jgi:histidinol-phosphatase (PHP family)|uniref:Histidinol-phosphatase n=3 Tax=Pseudomonas TaxID=286 RepID=A0A7Y8G3Q2_9PSED|nr:MULTISPECIES: histidinol-phosphatase [Pseudomonas]ASV34912.1 histidinol phosphate phosphatase [Pseudomonas sp. NS1(2017)]KGE65820.1 histidinol phosphate phosphatase [Pseudomonas fluorescens LMG 5329]NWA45743.1 histidinol-phosphatase [Pseudomonas reactans]NWB30194.1 histidinol-phosphatase [Pseudomonas gingeri]NWC36668.1 histidinol-phosphatase [Pseudomonas gingeri]